jgi:transcriptional regulator with XRE-family HTH domain
MKADRLPAIDGPHGGFAQRFRDALSWRGWLVYDADTGIKSSGSYESAAKMIDLGSRVTIGEWFRGRKAPSGATGAALAKRLGVSVNWLISGEGPMIADQLISIDHLTPENQVKILKMLRSMES